MKISQDRLRDILVSSGYVEEPQFNEAAQSALDLGKKVEDILIFRGLITPDALSKLIAESLKVAYIDLGHFVISNDALALLPEKIARTYRIIPIERDGNNIKLAMEDPSDFEAIEFTKRHSGLNVVPYYASQEGMRRALGQYKRNIRADFDRVIAENVKKASAGEDPRRAAEDLPVIKILDTIIEYAVAERASDIHIETQDSQVVVRYRIDGILYDIVKLPKGFEISLTARIKILSNLKLDEHRIPQDGRFKFNIDNEAISLRISIIPGFYGENTVMRLLRESSRPESLEELGLTGRNMDIVKKSILRPHGMILVTGPTGSGKTTTLYSVLNILNTTKVKICTIEDPIEYGINRVSQIQVSSKGELNFAAGLRALLRHDPDIMMVGEIRDGETAQIAVHASLTGHLVLSTLHTNDAIGALPRLLDMGVEAYLVASTVNVVLAQRLVRKICTACLVEYHPDPNLISSVTKTHADKLKNQKYYKGAGCTECGSSGFTGRIGIYEVLEVTPEIGELINKRAASDQILDVAKSQGMTNMLEDGLDKVSSGLTTIEEVMKAVLEN
jgi:type IV pilus assembly protein PilB